MNLLLRVAATNTIHITDISSIHTYEQAVSPSCLYTIYRAPPVCAWLVDTPRYQSLPSTWQPTRCKTPHPVRLSLPDPSSRTLPSDYGRCFRDTQTVSFSFARAHQFNQQHHISDIHLVILIDIRHIHIKFLLLRLI